MLCSIHEYGVLEIVDSLLLLQVGGDTLLQEGNLHSLCRNGVVDVDTPCCSEEQKVLEGLPPSSANL